VIAFCVGWNIEEAQQSVFRDFEEGILSCPRGTTKVQPPWRAAVSYYISIYYKLREQDSNLQPFGYGMLQSFRFGPDYLITLSEFRFLERAEGCRALLGLIGEILIP